MRTDRSLGEELPREPAARDSRPPCQQRHVAEVLIRLLWGNVLESYYRNTSNYNSRRISFMNLIHIMMTLLMDKGS